MSVLQLPELYSLQSDGKMSANPGAQIVLSVLDVRSQTDCRRDESRAEGEGCESAIFDKSSLKVMPLKKERIGFLMQPF